MSESRSLVNIEDHVSEGLADFLQYTSRSSRTSPLGRRSSALRLPQPNEGLNLPI
jgi:hypothetical protein